MSTGSSLASVREALAADRALLWAAVERVPANLRGRKPSPDRWSVAEVLEHLAIVEGRVVGMLSALIPAAPEGVPDPSTPSGVDRVAMQDRTNRISAPDPIQPPGRMTADEAWQSLEQSRVQLLALLETAEHRDLSQITRQHPVLGTLNGYQWLAAIGGHEGRHALQIDELAAVLASA